MKDLAKSQLQKLIAKAGVTARRGDATPRYSPAMPSCATMLRSMPVVEVGGATKPVANVAATARRVGAAVAVMAVLLAVVEGAADC